MTSSSDTTAPAAGLRRSIASAGDGATAVRAPSPVRVIDRVPPPPLPPKIDVAPLARALCAGFAAVHAQVETAFGELQSECVELALAAAERVVRRRSERGELDLESPLRELLAARRRELSQLPATLRLHPKDAEALAPKVAELAPPGASIGIVADIAQPRGHIALEFGAARLVRSLDHELKRLRLRLLDRAKV